MARHKLENELIAIEVEEHGAELKSLVRKNTGKEYMWKADPKFWGRTSPVLFPFVGAVKDKQFRTKGQTYTMGQHGFARDMDFTLDSQTEDTLWFVLKSNEETMAKYPYAFTLRIGYQQFAHHKARRPAPARFRREVNSSYHATVWRRSDDSEISA